MMIFVIILQCLSNNHSQFRGHEFLKPWQLAKSVHETRPFIESTLKAESLYSMQHTIQPAN